MGSCSGGCLPTEPCASHSSNAVSCSAKKGDGWKSAPGSPLSSAGSCSRHISAAMSQACAHVFVYATVTNMLDSWALLRQHFTASALMHMPAHSLLD